MGYNVKTILRSPLTLVVATVIVIGVAVTLTIIGQNADSNDDPEQAAAETTDSETTRNRRASTATTDGASGSSATTTTTETAPSTSAPATSNSTLSTAPQTQIQRESLEPGGGERAATDLEASSDCDPERGVTAQMSWSLASQSADAQHVALTQFADGFETGRFSLSNELPADTVRYTWVDGLEPGVVYRWEVLTRHDDAYTRSPTTTFRGADCFADT